MKNLKNFPNKMAILAALMAIDPSLMGLGMTLKDSMSMKMMMMMVGALESDQFSKNPTQLISDEHATRTSQRHDDEGELFSTQPSMNPTKHN